MSLHAAPTTHTDQAPESQTDTNGQPSGRVTDKASRKDIDRLTFVPVSENAVGETVLGPVTAYLDAGCPGPAGLGGCASYLGHGGDHMGEKEFHRYVQASLIEVLAGVQALTAERDSLKAKLLSGVLVPRETVDAIVEFLDERADVKDGPEGQVPDAAMQLRNELREAR